MQSPDLNACAERWIRTVREECLDRVIVLNESRLRWVLGEFVRYYNQRRSQRSLGLRPPEGPLEAADEGVTRRQLLGGLVNDYFHRRLPAPARLATDLPTPQISFGALRRTENGRTSQARSSAYRLLWLPDVDSNHELTG